ncbi:MAG: type II toxin-antitoxin system RelE/ParE family toxin [Simkaniaceae bacterium]|nr:type II toxin-antitoxin system RelE/ParE family toxin [Simkaniaceae bacterium]
MSKTKWTLQFSKDALKDLKKLDKGVSKRILTYLKERVLPLEDPRTLGKPLGHNLSHIWRYRVANYRILCELHDKTLVIEVVETGHRKDVYDPRH